MHRVKFLVKAFALSSGAFLCSGANLATAQSGSVEKRLRILGDDPDERVAPGFGAINQKYPITRDDQEDAQRWLDRYDDDRDGSLTPDEFEVSRWSRDNPFDFDLNRDGRLNLGELAQREAWRTLNDSRNERSDRDRRNSSGGSQKSFTWLSSRIDASRSAKTVPRNIERERDWRNESSRDSRSITSSILARFDRNQNRTLSEWEIKEAGFTINDLDVNRNGELDFIEIDSWVFEQINQRVADYSDVLPDWFFEKDTDDDGQVEMAEYADAWDEDRLAMFASIDTNADGVITTNEVLQSKASVGGRYDSKDAEVLAPRTTVLADIEVDEDFKIKNLQVQLSITHSYLEQLDGFLLGPDGERIELFTGVGGSDDNFQNTTFDDNAREGIRRARAPFRDTYQPEAIEKKQTSLSHFRGKSIRGVWQLVIETNRSDRFGILHQWSLIVTPE